jgi:hypothetical protein
VSSAASSAAGGHVVEIDIAPTGFARRRRPARA